MSKLRLLQVFAAFGMIVGFIMAVEQSKDGVTVFIVSLVVLIFSRLARFVYKD